MSRLIKKPIKVPGEVKLLLAGTKVEASGGGRTEILEIPEGLELSQEKDELSAQLSQESKEAKERAGTFWAELKNLLSGLDKPFTIPLRLHGVGYRAVLEGKLLKMTLGHSHPDVYELPEEVQCEIKIRWR